MSYENPNGERRKGPVLLDTTLRDGEQTPDVNLLLPEKLQITQLLANYGVPLIEGGFAGSDKVNREYFKRFRELELSTSEVLAFGRTGRDLDAMLEADPDGFVMVGKSDIVQVRNDLRMDSMEYLDRLAGSVKRLRETGKPVLFDAEFFFTGLGTNQAYAVETLRKAREAGAGTLVLCDTVGDVFPSRVYEATKAMVEEFGDGVGFHGHNDSGFADANTWIAYEAGANHLQATVNRMGERCGNASLLTLACNLYRAGTGVGLSMKDTMDLSRAVEIITGFRVPPNEPYVGLNAGRHYGGMHTDGMEKSKAYQFFDLRIIGNRISYSFGRTSGRATIVSEAGKYGVALQKQDPLVLELLEEIEEIGKVGDAQFYLLLNSRTRKRPEPFTLLRRTNTDIYDASMSPDTLSEATVHVQINGDVVHQAGEGDGPVHAADEALRNALRVKYPGIDEVELLFYDVVARRIPTARGTAAFVDVYTEFVHDGKKWTSLARHTDIIRASEMAIGDAYKHFLMKRGLN